MEANKPQILSIFEKSVNYTIYDTKWVPMSKKFVTIGSHARGTGALEVYEFDTPDESSNKYSATKISSAEPKITLSVGTFHASPLSNRRLATGDFAGEIKLYDLDRLSSNPTKSVTWEAIHNKNKKSIIKSIVGCGGVNIGAGPNELATAAEDGQVNIFDLRQKGEPVIELIPNKPSNSGDAKITDVSDDILNNNQNLQDLNNSRACWALAFGNAYCETERALTAGYDNGDVKMFDLRTKSAYWNENIKNGVVDLEFDRRDIKMNKLVATTLEGNIHCWDCRKLGENDEFARVTEIPHTSTAWRVRHVPQNRDLFITSSGSGHLYLWKYNYPNKRITEDGKNGIPGDLEILQKTAISTQPITGLDWNSSLLGLGIASSLDQTVRVFLSTRLGTC